MDDQQEVLVVLPGHEDLAYVFEVLLDLLVLDERFQLPVLVLELLQLVFALAFREERPEYVLLDAMAQLPDLLKQQVFGRLAEPVEGLVERLVVSLNGVLVLQLLQLPMGNTYI